MDGEYGIGRSGGSLPVESVQALAARQNGSVPERYIRPELEREEAIAIGGDEATPVIDFGKLFDPKSSDEEASKLHSVCANWGFFQLINHGVSDEIINKTKNVIKEFFELPLEEKKTVAQLRGEVEGYGNACIQYEEQKLDWVDMLYLIVLPPHIRSMKLWPTNPLSFREIMEDYSREAKRVTNYLFSVMSKNLGLESEKLYDIFKDGIQSIRINYYPPCMNPEKVIGVPPHSDAVGLTILLQVNEVQGLQIKRNGGWLTVKSIPGSFMVVIGDIIEIFSNGKYKSIEHRAIVSKEVERISIATFHTLINGDNVSPIKEIVEGEEVHYKSLSFLDYMKEIFQRKLEGKRNSDHMKLIK